MAGSSPAAADDMGAMRYRRSLHTALHRMTAVKADQVILSADPVQTCRLRFFQVYFFRPCILDTRTSRDHIIRRQHTVQERHLYVAYGILHVYFERLRLVLLRVNGGQPLYAILSF